MKIIALVMLVGFGLTFYFLEIVESGKQLSVDNDSGISREEKTLSQYYQNQEISESFQEDTPRGQKIALSDRNEVEIAKAVSIIESCLDQKKTGISSEKCVGTYAFECTEVNCGNYEVEAWFDLMKKYLDTLYGIDELSEPLKSSQNLWEQYFDAECSLTSTYWLHNRVIGNTESTRCSLTLASERTLRLRDYVINLDQRFGEF